MIKQVTSATKVITLALVLSFGLSYVYAWTAPISTPPGGNVSAPINTSGTAQTKTGKLMVNDVIAGDSFQNIESTSYFVSPLNLSTLWDVKINNNLRLPNGAGTGKVLVSSDDLGSAVWGDAVGGGNLPAGTMAGFCTGSGGPGVTATTPATNIGGTCSCVTGWSSISTGTYMVGDGTGYRVYVCIKI